MICRILLQPLGVVTPISCNTDTLERVSNASKRLYKRALEISRLFVIKEGLHPSAMMLDIPDRSPNTVSGFE
jgi:hypothetical protein